MPAVMTLPEYAKTIEDPAQRGIVEIFPQESDVLAAMPWKTTGPAYKYNLEGMPSGIAFRGLNEAYSSDTTVVNPQVEQVFIAGGDADVDKFLVDADASRRATEETSKIKGMARAITNAILSGDNATNPKSFDGLQTRVRGAGIQANSATAGGAALSLAALDELIDEVRQPTHLIMNRRLRRRFQAAMRNQTLAGNIMLEKDDLGRPVMSYNGIPFLVGYEAGPDGVILPFTETPSGGGTAQASSIYCVSLREGGVCGIQMGGIDSRDLGEIDDKPVLRTRVEWYAGMCVEDPYSIRRLTSITDAAIVA